MKWMNGRVLEWERGSQGLPRVNQAEFLAALNAWAKRRGLAWNETWQDRNTRLFGKGKGKKGDRRAECGYRKVEGGK